MGLFFNSLYDAGSRRRSLENSESEKRKRENEMCVFVSETRKKERNGEEGGYTFCLSRSTLKVIVLVLLNCGLWSFIHF